jgi:hypothetical protein
MSYANNNLLRYTDPTGHRACDNVDAAGNCITAPGGGGMGFGGLTPLQPSSKNNNNSGNRSQATVSNNVVSVPIGVSSVYFPTGSSYAEQAENSTCFGCSMEPINVANPFDLGNFVGEWGLNYLAINSHDIPVYANIARSTNGSVSVYSLTVDNTHTGATIAVARIVFKVSGDNMPCFSSSGSCVANRPYEYNVQPHLGIYSADTHLPGIGAITQPGSTQLVYVTPSGYPNNPTNTFHSSFEIIVVLGNSLTGNVYNPISATIHP